MKKIFSFLAIAFVSALLLSFLFANTADAFSMSDLGKLFTTGDQGLSFEQYKPAESLELQAQGYHEALTTSSDVKEFVIRIVNFALGFLGIIAVIIVIYGGVRYLTAAGVEESAQKGKKTIGYAAIGLIIILGSFALVNTVIKGTSTGTDESRFYVGPNMGGTFNAPAAQVRNIAGDIYNGFIFISKTIEEMKNIRSDANKESLNYGEVSNRAKIIPREDIIKYLYSVKERLANIRSSITTYSAAYVRINEFIRTIESDIDKIRNVPENTVGIEDGVLSVQGGGIEPCGEVEDFFEDCARYPSGVYPLWNEIKGELIFDNSEKARSLTNILDPLKKEYKEQLIKNLTEIVTIKQEISGVELVKTGVIGDLFNKMMEYYGFNPESPDTPKATGFFNEFNIWGISSDSSQMEKVGGALYNALTNQLDFAQELQNLVAVEAHLKANVTNGNAPLVVTFDVLNSADPAGGTIIDKNIDWSNLGGSATFEKVEKGEEGIQGTVDIKDAVTCSVPIKPDQNLSQDEQKIFGAAFRQCTFKYPGTYISTVKINSNNPAKYAPGMSSLIIKVNPPTTKIELKLTIGDKTIPVISYYKNGILKINRDYIPVTLSEAKSGINFDAAGTENVSEFRWDFGKEEAVAEANTYGQRKMSYTKEGKYTIKLEVVNKLGEIDQKIFTLDVRKVAARIKISPSENIYINTPISIDGTGSSTSSGKIKAYEWTIAKITQTEQPLDLKDNKNKPSFNFKFKEPGKYKIGLKVTSDLESVEAEPYILVVASKPPVALFDHEIKKANQPNTIYFNASKSFDPDGQDKFLEYEWSITPAAENGQNWIWANNTNLKEKSPVIKFKKKGDYEVTLTVTDSLTKGEEMSKEYGVITKTISIKNILDLSWADDQKVTGMLNANNEVNIDFKIISDNAIAYDIDFGDGNVSNGSISGSKTIPHTYVQAGEFTVEVTVYDSEDNDNSISRRVFIGGDNPVAKIEISVNGMQLSDLENEVEVSRKDVLTFDASESKNTDGTGRNLKFSWEFGDIKTSSSRTSTHSYKEISPKDPGYFLVKLKVFDKNTPNKIGQDSVKIKVVNKPPKFSSIQAIPDASNINLITPVIVNMKVYGAEDEDGEIIQYKWWYFDKDDPEEPLGIQITQIQTGKLTIGTSGKEGKEITYGFGLELLDSDNLNVSTEDILEKDQIPTLKVKNGPNKQPTAKFNINATSVFTGDKVVFTSASTDPDGRIVSYVWDFEGDGFFNNEPTEKSVAEHTYTEKNLSGYAVRLKVVDDKGGEAVSAPIKIYVDALGNPPTAAFKSEVMEGSGGKKIKFTNNSKADETAGAQITGYKWDFDTESLLDTADSDGDGIKNNDTDSEAKDPEHLYTKLGSYKVKLIVKDSHGLTDEAENALTIPLSGAPVAAFTAEIINSNAVITNNSSSNVEEGVTLTKFEWDFDCDVDSDGDGIKDNDADSELKNPAPAFTLAGVYRIRLKVTDSHGGSDEVINKFEVPASAVGLGTQTQTQTQTGGALKAVLITDPAPAKDGFIYLQGENGYINFNFSQSEGAISYYILDKNIYYDTDGNGIKNDDKDFKTSLPGTWKTYFEKIWGKTAVKLTVEDIYGNKNSTTLEIKFK